jgi:hypothetical protein
MARAQAVQIQCDRCKRVVTIAADKAKSSDKKSLVLSFNGADAASVELSYDDLCPSCETAVGRLIDEIKEWDRPIKQEFLGNPQQGPKIPSGTAAPVQSAPVYTPPKPHAVGNR